MENAGLVPLYLFAVGIIFYAGIMYNQVREHDRRIGTLETLARSIDTNIAALRSMYESGGPS